MKIKNILLLLATLSFLITNVSLSQGQSRKALKKKYKSFLDDGSKMIDVGYAYMNERTSEKKFVYKQFFPDTKQMTHYFTFSNKEMTEFDGKVKEWWDDGKVNYEGQYEKNLKVGEWKYYDAHDGFLESRGSFEDGEKSGLWTYFNKKEIVVGETNFENGKKQGTYKIFNDDGKLIEMGAYLDDEIINTTILDSVSYNESRIFNEVDFMPSWSGCEVEGDRDERTKCMETKFLRFVYGNIKYPMKAREKGVEGKAIAVFVISKKGKVKDIKILRGLCKEVKEEVTRIILMLPDWNPGMEDGKPVNVRYTLPVRFKLQ